MKAKGKINESHLKENDKLPTAMGLLSIRNMGIPAMPGPSVNFMR